MIDETRVVCHFKVVRQLVASEDKVEIYNRVKNGDRW